MSDLQFTAELNFYNGIGLVNKLELPELSLAIDVEFNKLDILGRKLYEPSYSLQRGERLQNLLDLYELEIENNLLILTQTDQRILYINKRLQKADKHKKSWLAEWNKYLKTHNVAHLSISTTHQQLCVINKLIGKLESFKEDFIVISTEKSQKANSQIEPLTIEKLKEYGFKEEHISALTLWDNQSFPSFRKNENYFASNVDGKIYSGKEALRQWYFKKTAISFPYKDADLIPEYFNLKKEAYLNEQQSITGIIFNKQAAIERFKILEIDWANYQLIERKSYSGFKDLGKTVDLLTTYIAWVKNWVDVDELTIKDNSASTTMNDYPVLKSIAEFLNHHVPIDFLNEHLSKHYIKGNEKIKLIEIDRLISEFKRLFYEMFDEEKNFIIKLKDERDGHNIGKSQLYKDDFVKIYNQKIIREIDCFCQYINAVFSKHPDFKNSKIEQLNIKGFFADWYKDFLLLGNQKEGKRQDAIAKIIDPLTLINTVTLLNEYETNIPHLVKNWKDKKDKTGCAVFCNYLFEKSLFTPNNIATAKIFALKKYGNSIDVMIEKLRKTKNKEDLDKRTNAMKRLILKTPYGII